MECPECKNILTQLSMSGNEERIQTNYHCEKCYSGVVLTWYPKTDKKDYQNVVLRACPFCGGENIYIDGYQHAAGKRWRVLCLDCMATVDNGCIQQKYQSIEAWNRRVDNA